MRIEMNSRTLLAVGFAAALLLGASRLQEREGRWLDETRHHLGNDVTKDWPEAAAEPEGTRLDVRFESRPNAGEWTLFLEQRSVDSAWRLKVNGVEIARLRSGADAAERAYPVPAGCVADGENVLSLEPDDPGDDVVLGRIRLVERSLRQMHSTRPVQLRVIDEATREHMPARITIVDAEGRPASLFYAERPRTAVRDGVLYVGAEDTRFELPPGAYTVHATHGMEWSLSTLTLRVDDETDATVEHVLRREVDTRGYVAADTHIHTLQFSGHGDASADERQVTLAGEGVELAIATDHNHNTDYRPFQRSLGLSSRFTAVVGNEVTTKVGHFNGFPLDPQDEIPPHDSTDFVAIVDGMRAKGAKVVILNRPRWPSHDDSPFGNHGLDPVLGRFDPPLELTMDATELVNSTTEEADPLFLFRDWLALLNSGVRLFAVGSSDSHTVGDPVGQGRTYVPSKSDDPARIDVDAACDAIKNGRTSISMGIFATILVDGRWTMGDTATPSDSDRWLPIEVRVRAPSWVTPRKARLFVEGDLLAEQDVPRTSGAPTDVALHFDLPFPIHDTWVVCVVTGKNVDGPYWPLLNPYTLAATNPVFLDVEGDGWSCAREIAERMTRSMSEDELRGSFGFCEGGVRAHIAALEVAKLGPAATNAERRVCLYRLSGASDAEAREAIARGARTALSTLFGRYAARFE